MHTKWVGWTAGLMLTLMMIGSGFSKPHDDYYRADFLGVDPGNSGWELVNGSVLYNESYGWAGDQLSWLVLEDDNDTGGANISRVRAAPGTVNTTLTSYEIHAIIERDDDYVAPNDVAPNPGTFGITFGEGNGTGYFAAGFNDGMFLIGAPNATSQGTDIIHSQPDWGDVPPWVNTVDDRHRYSIYVDGTTLRAEIDGWPLGSFTLPAVPAGTFGLAAVDDTRLYVEQVIYAPLDDTGPNVEIWRPADGTAYVFDQPVDIFATGLIVAVGDLTIGADITDDIIGTKVAFLRVDGEMVSGSGRVDPGIKTNWTLDTTQLSLGYHTITVEAYDWSNNRGEASVEVLVVAPSVDGHTVSTALRTADEATTGLL